MLTTEPVPRAALPRPDLAESIADEAAALEVRPAFPHERIAHIRQAAARMGVEASAIEDIRHAALLVERAAAIDLGVPTASRVPGVALAKTVIRAAMIWYLRFLAHQVQALGEMAARLGFTVARRVEELDSRVVSIEARLAALESRSLTLDQRSEE